MADKDLLNILTREDSKRLTDAMMEASEQQNKIRMLDHEVWKHRQEREHDSKMQLDHAYKWHVYGASILNMISTAVIVILVLKVVTAL